MVPGLWAIIAVALALGVFSLRGDREREAYVRERLAAGATKRAMPPATVIVPVKGEDEGLAGNLAALAGLDYPDYELIVAARAAGDIPAGVVPERARVVIASDGDAATSEKIQNLLAAVAAARPESEVLAFADSDGRTGRGWLRALAAALDDERAGAATGYRHYLPEPADFWSLLRSVWNGVIAGGYGPRPAEFAWGGAMAIRRRMFDHLRIGEHWRGEISDDYALSAAVRDAGLEIRYAPGAAVVSADHTGGRELLGWIRRQLLITRVYRPRLWWFGAVAHLIYCGAMAAALTLAVAGHWTGFAALGGQLALGLWKGARRLRLLRTTLPSEDAWFRGHGWTHVVWVPLGTWLWLAGFAASAVGDTILWRGHRYRLSRERHAS